MLLIINIVVFVVLLYNLSSIYLSLAQPPQLAPFLIMCRPAPDQTIYPFDCLLSSQSFTSEFTLEYYNHYSPRPNIYIYTLWFPPSIRINTTAGWLTEDRNPLMANNHHPLESAHFRAPTSALEVHREGKAEWNKIKHWKKTIYVQTHITTTRGSGQSREDASAAAAEKSNWDRGQKIRYWRNSSDSIPSLACLASCTRYRASTVSCSAPS